MSEIPGALLEALIDTAKLLPILFLTYLAMEAIEHYAGDRTYAWIKKARGAGPLLGGLIGIIPQCGFAGGAASLYAAGAVSAGTLAAVFIATSDEMLPVLISEGASSVIWKILLYKFVAAVVIGWGLDIALRLCRKKPAEVDVGAVCARDGCDCDEEEHGGIFLPALRHTVKIGLIILAASAALGVLFCFVGEEELSALPINVPVLGEALAALFGLIPNCSVSVLLTKLYTDGIVDIAPMLAGLCANGGVGLIVLWRMSGDRRRNAAFTAFLWAAGVVAGIVARLIFA